MRNLSSELREVRTPPLQAPLATYMDSLRSDASRTLYPRIPAEHTVRKDETIRGI